MESVVTNLYREHKEAIWVLPMGKLYKLLGTKCVDTELIRP